MGVLARRAGGRCGLSFFRGRWNAGLGRGLAGSRALGGSGGLGERGGARGPGGCVASLAPSGRTWVFRGPLRGASFVAADRRGPGGWIPFPFGELVGERVDEVGERGRGRRRRLTGRGIWIVRTERGLQRYVPYNRDGWGGGRGCLRRGRGEVGSFFFLGVGSAGPGCGFAGFFASGGSGGLGERGGGGARQLRGSPEFALPDRRFFWGPLWGWGGSGRGWVRLGRGEGVDGDG